jgi:hypothetical protein
MTTSFRNLFRQGDVSCIEIPKIQRDYAQGRQDGEVPRIRKTFLKVLHDALTGGKAVSLDFVYGEVENGRMIPLDGQQRLTTLFLLHWYLAARSDVNSADSDFLKRFTYETRYSSRDFCRRLVAQRPPFPLAITLSEWLRDQSWYAGSWQHDPSIQSMLVMLDDMHSLLRDADVAACQAAWQRLVAVETPAVTFESLSVKDMGLTDELYIKMNSRGKPLTPFEHFKADFQQMLGEVSETHLQKFEGKETPYEEFIRKVDHDWSDLLWPLRGDDNIIDQEFLRLFRFLTDIIISRNGLPIKPDVFDNDIDLWAKGVYGISNLKDPLAAQRYLFDALDRLRAAFLSFKSREEIDNWFNAIFTEKGYRPGAVAIFDKDVNLLSACCEKYGLMAGKARHFTLQRTLLLFAVLEYLMPITKPENFNQRLRTARNLIFASTNEIRVDNFPALLYETADLIHNGDLAKVQTYNTRQIDEERRKADFLARNPDHSGLRETLQRLEDHDLLRGCLAAFDLNVDALTFVRRAQLFHEVFPENGAPPFRDIGAALLACGDYFQKTGEGHFQFGSPEQPSVWRELLTSPARDDFLRTSQVLLKMLDALATSPTGSIPERLQTISNGYLAQQEAENKFDWRYYLVKYEAMRSGKSGLYISSAGAMGFDLLMMDVKQYWNSYFRDPYLLAVIESSGAREKKDVVTSRQFGTDAYRPEGRWIELARTSERTMSCRQEGFQLQAPSQAAELAAFNSITNQNGVGNDLVLRIPQVVVDDVTYDQKDRVLVGSRLLQAFLALST